MRVLFVANAEKTVFLMHAPLAWALRTAGHDVRVACQPSFVDVVTQAGLTAVPVGRNFVVGRMMEVFLEPEAWGELMTGGLKPPYDAADDPAGASWERMLAAYTELCQEGFRYENFPILAGLVDLARSWQPDLVLWGPLNFAGAVAAKACGAVHARIPGSIDVYGVTREVYRRLMAEQPPDRQADPLAEWLTGYGRKFDFEFTEDMVTGQFTIDQLPGSMRLEAGLRYVPMQYMPYGGAAEVPGWLWDEPSRPRVALTLGIGAAEQFNHYSVHLGDVFAALADSGVEVVATVLDTVLRKQTTLPDNVRAVSYVPLHALASTCAAVINHAGCGTMLTVARDGVPQLTVPWDFDEPLLANRLTARGAGLDIHADSVTPAAIRDGLQRLVEEPRFRAGAHALRDEMRAMPTPNEVAAALPDLVDEYREG